MEILGEFKHQTTSQTVDLQNDFLGIENRRWVLANSNTETINANGKLIFPVPVLRSKQASAGLHYNKKQFLISAEAFIKNVDGITSRSQSFQNQFQFFRFFQNFPRISCRSCLLWTRKSCVFRVFL